MNKQLVEGRIKAAAGKVPRPSGKLTVSKKQETKGGVREQASQVEQAQDDLKELPGENGRH